VQFQFRWRLPALLPKVAMNKDDRKLPLLPNPLFTFHFSGPSFSALVYVHCTARPFSLRDAIWELSGQNLAISSRQVNGYDPSGTATSPSSPTFLPLDTVPSSSSSSL
jgi:hypothetical protein